MTDQFDSIEPTQKTVLEKGRKALDVTVAKSREAVSTTVSAVKEKPITAAAIVGGVAAAVAGVAYGASVLSKKTPQEPAYPGDAIDPESVPGPVTG